VIWQGRFHNTNTTQHLVKFKNQKKGLKKEFKTGCIKLPMQLCCKCGLVLWILPCQIPKWRQFKDSKWSLAQNLDFLRGPRLFCPSKDFVPGPFRILELALFRDLAG
jgi:hypothetical protein